MPAAVGPALLTPPCPFSNLPPFLSLPLPPSADVAVQIESDKVAGLKKELAELDAQLARTQRLLKIADPDG